MTHLIVEGNLTPRDVYLASQGNTTIQLSNRAYDNMAKSRRLVNEYCEQNRAVYGITTGFGKFSDVSISREDIAKLQLNLIMSHACGVGQPILPQYVRAMMLLRINALAVGNSGISKDTIDALVALFNSGVIPYVPCKGSLGASGDLVPLAHMTLTLLGQGRAYYEGQLLDSAQALKRAGLTPITLSSKEGLALINGTQAMNSYAVITLERSATLNKVADITGALTLEAQRGIIDAFDERLHILRNQQGQLNTASNIRKLTQDSKRITRQGQLRVQDAYTLRCIPQIHGPSKDTLRYCYDIISREVNAVTDNPVIFPEGGDAISGGNFHGQCLATTLDYLAISISELANVSERRIERLVNAQLSNLPAFLAPNGGLNSGFMIPQYVAASLVGENKVLCHPASVDSITSSANQEDHVSMGMTAARKAKEVADNVNNVLAIELLCACQAIDMGQDLPLGKGTYVAYQTVRKHIPFMDVDRFIAPDIEKCATLIEDGTLLNAVQDAVGELL